LVFAGELKNPASIGTSLAAFIAFCLVSSAGYIFNDFLDRESDRLHPEKRHRPLAAGLVSPAAALLLALFALAAGLVIAAVYTNLTALLLMLAYLASSLYYSIHLKKVFLLDVFSVALGFVLRVLAGAYAIEVVASHWLILCTLLLSLFLGFSKRRHEILLLGDEPSRHRSTLSAYTPELIASMNHIVCSATVVCYALYTVAPDTVAKFRTDRLVFSVPFVLYGLFRYLYLVQSRREGGNPGALLLRDRPLLLCVVCWLLYCAYIIYFVGRGVVG